jgi:hypothetical protein
VDSPAVQITTIVNGERSLNATAALRTDATLDVDAGFVRIAQEAELFSGLGAKRPVLRSLAQPEGPGITWQALAAATGSFQATAAPQGNPAIPVYDPMLLYPDAIGAYQSSGAAAGGNALAALLTLMGDQRIGGVQNTGAGLAFALRAYTRNGT